jgi:hypothetical protein
MNNPMNDGDKLTQRQQTFVEGLARGLTVQQAAKQAAFSPSYAKKASRLLKIPAVAQELSAIRSEARREAAYGLQEHVKELDRAILAAYSHKAMMAVSRLLRDKGEAYGLYINRAQEVPIDLKGALEQARTRIIQHHTPQQAIPEHGNGTSTDPDSPASHNATWRRD